MAILVIEDNPKHFKYIHDFASNEMLHSTSPDSEKENVAFITALRSWLTEDAWINDINVLSNYLDKEYDVILLDMELEESLGALSGKKVLEVIRNSKNNKYTPVLILTTYEFEEVDTCFRHKDYFANYYMSKSLNGEVLSNKFFENRLRPVLHMLINWKSVAFSNYDAHQIMITQLDEITKLIKAESGLLNTKVDDVMNAINMKSEEIIILTKIHLRIVQAQVKENDPRLGLLIDNFVDNFRGHDFSEFPMVQSKRDQIADFFKNSKNDLRRLLREGVEEKVKDEFMEYVEINVKKIAGCDEDTPLTLVVAKLLYKTIAQTWKFIKFEQ